MEYLEILKDTFLTDDRYMYIVDGVIFSIGITLFSAILGIILGLFLAVMKLSHWYPLRNIKGFENFNPLSKIAYVYIDVIRGTPVVVQLMILANLVFVDALRDTPILIIAGIEGLDKGQMEAGRALGLSYGQTMKKIIVPQAIKNILPALVSEFITLLKETSIIGFIGGVDLLRSANIITSQTYRGVEPLLAVGFIYLILTTIFTMCMRKVERGLKVSD